MKLKAILLLALAVSPPVSALTCSIVGADGKVYYTQTTASKTLGTVSRVKACKDPVMLIPYKDARGMKLFLNPKSVTDYPCFFLKVKDNTIQIYDATLVDGVCPAQVQ